MAVEIGEIALRAIGSLCVLWTLFHVHWATTKEDYLPPRLFRNGRNVEPIKLSQRLEAGILLLGFILIGVQITHLLIWWIPYDWGNDVEGEFQRTRDYLQYGFGGFLGLAMTSVLTHVGPAKR
ncbi:MAG: hypothetical protein Q8R82_17075 [Hyphomonadaceae bacterium]|nr:hypothetical protein [Hyphomonadaceae bacterium]